MTEKALQLTYLAYPTRSLHDSLCASEEYQGEEFEWLSKGHVFLSRRSRQI